MGMRARCAWMKKKKDESLNGAATEESTVRDEDKVRSFVVGMCPFTVCFHGRARPIIHTEEDTRGGHTTNCMCCSKIK